MKTTITIAACGLFMMSVAGCRKDEKKNGLDSTPPAAGSVAEGTTDTPGTPATDPTTPALTPQEAAPGTTAPAPSPGTTAAPSPGTTAAPSPGTTAAPAPGTATPPPGTMRGSTGAATGAGTGVGTMMNDAGAGRVPPPAGGATP